MEKPKEYFAPTKEEEQYPVHIDPSLNEKYITLEKIFSKYYNESTLEIAGKNSGKERMKKNLDSISFVYGEITFKAMAYIFEYTKNIFDINEEGIFYDLGSGVGRGVFCASLCHSFKQYIGIEYLESIYKISIDIQNKYMKELPKYINDKKYKNFFPDYYFDDNKEKHLPNILFKNDDFLNEDLSNASFIYANSTCFTQDLMEKLSNKINKEVKKGCIVVTTTKTLSFLNKKKWEIKKGIRREMSWGVASLHVQRKIQD